MLGTVHTHECKKLPGEGKTVVDDALYKEVGLYYPDLQTLHSML